MVGTYDTERSWLKVQRWVLDNGFAACVEQTYYGPAVTRIETHAGELVWHCSNGNDGLPDWVPRSALYAASATHLVAPFWEKVYP